MHSILGALCCAVACAHPLSQGLVLQSRRCTLTRLLQLTFLAGPIYGVDVHGRAQELHGNFEVDPIGHLARRDIRSSTLNTKLAHASGSMGEHKVSPPDTAATRADLTETTQVDPLAKQMMSTTLSSFAEATEVAKDEPSMLGTNYGNFGLSATAALVVFVTLGCLVTLLCVYKASYMLALCIAWVTMGVACVCYAERWSVLTGLYVMVQIITTIGYGDIVPTTSPVAKVLCGLYVVGSLLLIGTVLTDLMDKFMKTNQEVLRAKLRSVQAKSKKGGDGAAAQNVGSSMNYQLLVSFSTFALFVAFGTVFFATYESCACGYGMARIAGCNDDSASLCEQTGGISKSWLDAFNMSIITLTTVGFGDHTPISAVGRAVGILWMLVGVATTGNFVSAFGQMILANDKENKRIGRVSKELFNKIDKNSDGTLSRIEFRTYALIKFGLVEEEDLDEIDNLFRAIDSDGSGQLTFDEIMEHCDS